MVALLAVNDIDQLSLEIIIDKMVLVGTLQSELQFIQQLIKKLISIMLLPDIDGHVITIKIVQTKALRNQENPLSEGKLVDDVLELPEEIDGIDHNLCPNNTPSEWLNHLQLLQHSIDIAYAAKVHDTHLLFATVD